ncbi:MAG TPA: hypothetical protein VM913_06965 [Sphingomicrobium sp.]|nr:hypothetical protein [Sphingomicrobium sp.]
MAESLNGLSLELRRCLRDLHGRADRLSPLDIHARMDAIRDLAARDGLGGLEELARRSAQLALLPGCRVAVAECLSHVDDAVAAISPQQRQAVLAAVAVRLH